MAIEMPPGERKYQTEFTLVVAIEGAYLLRPQDLKEVPVAVLDGQPACHLYVVTRAPRVSIDPATVSITDTGISGTVTMQRGAEFENFPFALRHDFGAGPFVWQSAWPHEQFSVTDAAGAQVSGGVCALLGSIAQFWPPQALKQEILYVGQAFGSAGERTAWDRIQKHETLQRILADQLPDAQVWLTMAAIIDVQLVSETSPTQGAMSGEDDHEHIQQIYDAFHNEGFREREAVALAEAGLIRGWQPEYNDRLKHTFPARKQVSLETARELDLHGLVVEWQSTQLPAFYWSGDQGGKKLYFFGYKVHVEADRAMTLTLRSLEVPLLQKPLVANDEPRFAAHDPGGPEQSSADGVTNDI
ncbi:MAG: hypothetical protein NVSMB48_09080 [Marmoricola sp.]